MKPAKAALSIVTMVLIGGVLLALAFCSCCPCPPKKTVVVKHVHHYQKKKPKQAAPTTGESLQSKKFPVPDEPQDRLIGQPEPQPTP